MVCRVVGKFGNGVDMMSKNPVPPSDEILDHIHEAYQLRGDTVYRIRGDYVGSTNRDGYKQFKMGVEFDFITISAHHIAWFLHYGSWPEEQLDHKDRNRKNNSISNLRYADNYSNNRNRQSMRDLPIGVKLKKSGYYEAYIGFEGKKIYCGMGHTAWEAFEKFKDKYLELFNEEFDESRYTGGGGSD